MTFIIFIDNAGFKYTPSPHKIARGGPQLPRIKKYQARDRPASENLFQARGSPRAAGARGPRGVGQPMQGFNANADGMSRQCGQCQRPDCPVSATDWPVLDADAEMEMVDHPFAASEVGESMDADLLPELSGETWVASALIEEFTADLLQAGSNADLITASRQDATLATVRGWIQSESTPDMSGLCWILSGIVLLAVTSGKSVH